MERLKDLVSQLESPDVDVDALEAVVKESVELITACRARLRATQTSVDTLLAGLQEEARSGAPPARPVLLIDDLDQEDPFEES